ncbi:MAG: hypothetical protein VKK32_00440 [Candidatus Melainabacteria bacterium]|nr:hypothetical protein [Candidatus Melainabacteria bacterium]
MVLGLLRNIPILNSFSGKSAASQESSETEAAAKANEKAIIQEGLKPLFIVVLPEGDFSELKAKLKEKFNGRDLHFEVDPELKKPKLYILKPNALAKRNLETALDKAFIKDNYKSIELSGDENKLGESLLRTMNTEFMALKGAERKVEYTQKEIEKANSRQTLETLSKAEAKSGSPAERLKATGIHICGEGCEHGRGRELTKEDSDSILEQLRQSIMASGNSRFVDNSAVDSSKTNQSITSTKQERIQDLQNFLVKLNDLGDNHQTHTQLIESSYSIYIVNDKNKGQTFDPTQLELTFAHREKLSDDFTVHKLPLFDFLRGVELTASSKRISNGDIHQKEMHAKEVVQAQSILSVLKTLENQSPLTALKNNFERNLNQISSKIKKALKQVQSASQAVLNPMAMNQSLITNNILNKGTSFINTGFGIMNTERSQETSSTRKSIEESTKELLRNIFSPENRSFQSSAIKILNTFSPDETKLISSPISQYFNEQINQNRSQIQSPSSRDLRKNLNAETVQNYINNRVQISQQLNLLPELLDTAFSYDKNAIARFEQSDPSTIYTNKQLAEEYLQNKTNASGEKENDKQAGGIALTGQFSFIDRKDFHERHQTYKDFPPLPESWKAAQPTETKPEPISHHTEAATNPQSESVRPAEEENLDREN